MKTQQQIQFDHNLALSQAKQLENLSVEMESVTRSVNTAMQEVSAAWKGENASAYLRKGEQVKNNVSRIAADLQTIAEEIRAAANRVYQTELNAVRIAQTH